MTNIEIRKTLKQFCPKPGFVGTHTRASFEDLVYDTIEIGISESKLSNEKRLKELLTTCNDEQINKLLTALK